MYTYKYMYIYIYIYKSVCAGGSTACFDQRVVIRVCISIFIYMLIWICIFTYITCMYTNIKINKCLKIYILHVGDSTACFDQGVVIRVGLEDYYIYYTYEYMYIKYI
jgi:hypothetical protein